MEFKTHNDGDIEVVGTSLCGYIDISYDELVEKFGEPLGGDEYKVDAEWDIVNMETGAPATIYNYKDGRNYNGDDGDPTNQIRDWHIGGRGPDAVEMIKEIFPNHTIRSGY